jgi:large subunit ribosomal protein L37e
MTKGTPSMGKRNKRTHIICRRCGKHSYHASNSECASCGFGKTTSKKKYAWQWKPVHGNRLK